MHEWLIDWQFWLTMLVAALVKIRSSQPVGIVEGIFTVLTGVGISVIGTDPVLAFLELDRSQWQYVIAGTVMISGELIARRILQFLGLPFQEIINMVWPKR